MPAAQWVFVELMPCRPVSGGHARVFLQGTSVGRRRRSGRGHPRQDGLCPFYCTILLLSLPLDIVL